MNLDDLAKRAADVAERAVVAKMRGIVAHLGAVGPFEDGAILVLAGKPRTTTRLHVDKAQAKNLCLDGNGVWLRILATEDHIRVVEMTLKEWEGEIKQVK